MCELHNVYEMSFLLYTSSKLNLNSLLHLIRKHLLKERLQLKNDFIFETLGYPNHYPMRCSSKLEAALEKMLRKDQSRSGFRVIYSLAIPSVIPLQK